MVTGTKKIYINGILLNQFSVEDLYIDFKKEHPKMYYQYVQVFKTQVHITPHVDKIEYVDEYKVFFIEDSFYTKNNLKVNISFAVDGDGNLVTPVYNDYFDEAEFVDIKKDDYLGESWSKYEAYKEYIEEQIEKGLKKRNEFHKQNQMKFIYLHKGQGK